MRSVDVLSVNEIVLADPCDAGCRNKVTALLGRSHIFTIYVRCFVNKILGVRQTASTWHTDNPAPHPKPVSFSTEQVDLLRHKNLLAAFKGDGERKLLVLFHISGKDYLTSYDVHWQGGLLYECVANRPKNCVLYMFDTEFALGVYNVHDIFISEGAALVARPFAMRHNIYQRAVQDLFNNPIRKIDAQVVAKRFTSPQELFRAECVPPGHDGVILVDALSPIKFGTDWNIVKWKPPEMNTVDMMAPACESSQSMFVMDGTTPSCVPHCSAPMFDKNTVCEMRPVKVDGYVTWQFVKTRGDKKRANSSQVLNGATKAFLQNTTFADLRSIWP